MDKKSLTKMAGGAALGAMLMFAAAQAGYLVDFCQGVIDKAETAIEQPAE